MKIISDTFHAFNPVSERHHAIEDFKHLSTARKVAVVALTILTAVCTLFIATVPLFRLWVHLLHPKPIAPPAPAVQQAIIPYLGGSPELIVHPQTTEEQETSSVVQQANSTHQAIIPYLGGSWELIAHPQITEFNNARFALNIGGRTLDLHVDGKLLKERQGDFICYRAEAIIRLEHMEFLINQTIVSAEDANTPEEIAMLILRHQRALLTEENPQEIIDGWKEYKTEESENSELLGRLIKDGFTPINRMGLSYIDNKAGREALGLTDEQCNLISYIGQYLSSDVTLENNDTIAFQDGRIVKSEKSSVDVFRHIMKETYGEVLTERVFRRYDLFNHKTLTFLDVKKALVGVAANVLGEDLKDLYLRMQEREPGTLESYRVGNTLYALNKELYLQIKESGKDFEKLTSEELNFLYSGFTTAAIGRENVSDVLKHLNNKVEGEDFLFRHDLSALALMESWNQLDMRTPRFAIGEFTGKSLAYLELKQGLVLRLPQVEENTPSFYTVADSVNKNDGVVAHLLTPLNTEQILYKDENEYTFLVFRGTAPSPEAFAGGASVFRDIHHQGVGRSTYDAQEAEIQDMVENYLKNSTAKNVTLHISGHSLGGCDTQRAVVSILKKVASAEEGSPWKKLNYVIATPQNAPKVNPTVNKELKDAVRMINERQIAITVELDHIRFFDKQHEDLVQKFGDILLGVDHHGGTVDDRVLENSKWFIRRIIKITMNDDQGLVDGVLARHSYRPFNKAYCDIEAKIDILSADNEEQRKEMEIIMGGNYYWNDEEMQSFGRVVHGMLWHGGWLLRETKKATQGIVVNVANTAFSLARVCSNSENNKNNFRRYY